MERPLDREVFKVAFLDRFFPIELREINLVKFTNLRQGSMSVKEYSLRFTIKHMNFSDGSFLWISNFIFESINPSTTRIPCIQFFLSQFTRKERLRFICKQGHNKRKIMI